MGIPWDMCSKLQYGLGCLILAGCPLGSGDLVARVRENDGGLVGIWRRKEGPYDPGAGSDGGQAHGDFSGEDVIDDACASVLGCDDLAQ